MEKYHRTTGQKPTSVVAMKQDESFTFVECSQLVKLWIVVCSIRTFCSTYADFSEEVFPRIILYRIDSLAVLLKQTHLDRWQKLCRIQAFCKAWRKSKFSSYLTITNLTKMLDFRMRNSIILTKNTPLQLFLYASVAWQKCLGCI